MDKLELADDKLTLEFSTVLAGVKLSLKGTDASRSAGAEGITSNVTAEYTRGKDLKAGMDIALVGKNVGLTSLHAVFVPRAGFLLGASAQVNPKNLGKPSKLDLAVGYNSGDFSFGAVTGTSKEGDYFKSLAVAVKSSVSSELSVGALVNMPTPQYATGGETKIALGLAYKPSKEMTLNVKGDRNGKVAASFAHVLSPLATVRGAAAPSAAAAAAAASRARRSPPPPCPHFFVSARSRGCWSSTPSTSPRTTTSSARSSTSRRKVSSDADAPSLGQTAPSPCEKKKHWKEFIGAQDLF